MNKQLEFLSALLLVSGVLSILCSVLEPEKAKELNTWYHILKNKKDTYNFDATIKRTKIVYYYLTVISTLGVIASFINQGIGELFVWVSFLSLIFSLYYLYPVKVNSDAYKK